MTDWISSFPLTQYIVNFSKEQVCRVIRTGPVPQHIGFIMDGNRTYAKKKHMELKDGHNAGFESMAKILETCYDCGVNSATVFAFSIENFKRSNYEINWLMQLGKTKFKHVIGNGEMCERFGVQIRVLGDLSLLPTDVRDVLLEAQEITKNNERAILNVCWSYTSREDMTHSIKDIINEDIPIEKINESTISKHLYTGATPKLDLLIRTSGVYRLSDFLLWECIDNDCDIEILDVLWPQFSPLMMIWLLLKWSFNKTYYKNRKNHSSSQYDDNTTSILVKKQE